MGEGVATDGLLYATMEIGRAYWISQGYDPPAVVDICEFDGSNPSTAAMRVTQYGYFMKVESVRVCWNRSWVTAYRLAIREGTRRSKRAAYRMGCEVAAHEWGHVLGKEHSDGGVMKDEFTPFDCIAWAWQRVPYR